MFLPKSSMSLGYQRPDTIKASSGLIAKVVFCSATCAETRKFSVHDKDFHAFCAIVHESLQYYDDDDEADCSFEGNSIEMFYLDIWSNEWIRFDCPSTWEQAKNMFQSPLHFNNNHISQLQIKVQLINDHSVDIKQHCSLNGRSSTYPSSSECNNRRSSHTTKGHSRSIPSHFYSPVTPDYQLTVSFSSLEDLIRMSEEKKTVVDVPTATEKNGDDGKRSRRDKKSTSRSEKKGRIKHSRTSSDESKKKKKKTTTVTPIATTSDSASVTTKTIGTIETMDMSPAESQEKRQRKKSSRKSSSSSSSSCLISQSSCNFWWGYSNIQNDDWSGHSNTSSIV